ncbi:MAG: hypothetical protein HQK77_00550 [Desulfobacterales bacterium]|nr:hypothetical protein [Desulfobacterales bacterium]
MKEHLAIHIEETNLEIFDRMVKATAKKYDCSLHIDFQNGNKVVKFIGANSYLPHIVDEVLGYLPSH